MVNTHQTESCLHDLLDGFCGLQGRKAVVRFYMNPPLALSMRGWPETFLILVVVVLLFGAKKLPELARGLGQSLAEFKKARDEFESELRKSTAEVEVKTPAERDVYQGTSDEQRPQPRRSS